MNTHLLPLGEEVPLCAEEDSEVALTTDHPHGPDRLLVMAADLPYAHNASTTAGCESIHYWAKSDSQCRSHSVRTERGSQSHFVQGFPSECATSQPRVNFSTNHCDTIQAGCISTCISTYVGNYIYIIGNGMYVCM